MSYEEALDAAARELGRATHAVAFTGAGMSVESGVPPFRGRGGIWSRWDPNVFELDYFRTQNIDNLHHRAGSSSVWEYHGNSRDLTCLSCGAKYPSERALESEVRPRCDCGGLLKPDFIFFGEQIPSAAAEGADRATRRCDLMLVIGTTGEVYTGEITNTMIREKSAAALPDLLGRVLDIA